jgi:hypothetical protein
MQLSYKTSYKKLIKNGISICRENGEFYRANNIRLYSIEIRTNNFFYGTHILGIYKTLKRIIYSLAK